MTSYYGGQPTGFAPTRAAGRTLLGTRAAVAGLTHRSERTVRNRCAPVACDVGTRAYLYDLDACAALLAPLRRVA